MRDPQLSFRSPVLNHGFVWDAADAYLFDIDGTLLNSRDAVHYFAFLDAAQEVLGVVGNLEGISVHGNTDIGIMRAVFQRAGVDDAAIDVALPKLVERMCVEVARNYEHLRPEVCPSIPQLLSHLRNRGKLLAAASGNLEKIGRLKLKKAGLESMFAFGSFSWPRETRAQIVRFGVSQARQRLGAEASVCLVGDTPADIEAARAAGIPVITLATGIYSFGELQACRPDACLESAADLPVMAPESRKPS